MAMSRRQLLRMLLMSPIAMTLDVEKLLWVPGQVWSVPEMPSGFHGFMSMAEVNGILKEVYWPAVHDLINSSNLLSYYK